MEGTRNVTPPLDTGTDPRPATACDVITRAYETTTDLDSMISQLHERGYEIRPIGSRWTELARTLEAGGFDGVDRQSRTARVIEVGRAIALVRQAEPSR